MLKRIILSLHLNSLHNYLGTSAADVREAPAHGGDRKKPQVWPDLQWMSLKTSANLKDQLCSKMAERQDEQCLPNQVVALLAEWLYLASQM